ncbi:MAG: hypothetical protein BWX88_02770 [Planctomycetes bacterium ADurb.Bin126]|nr:MAG: hypothetical protein BWX88_02770 [Planctomycetes bacterium ADurb.Bin126]HOD79945.1 hypothetical protein [Phycisphaerae bacterium]HQL73240.1 hypothetical protein [Phycisphaerae bacterium]
MSYRLYKGVGDDPAAIDYGTIVDTIASGSASASVAGLGLSDGVYWFALRAVSEAGIEETNTTCVTRVEISGGALQPARPNPLLRARADAIAGGGVRVTFEYDSARSPATAARVRVAGFVARRQVPAAGDWAAYLGTAAIVGSSRRGTVTLSGTWSDGETLWLWARTETSAGVGSKATEIGPVRVRAAGPADVSAIEAEELS